MASVDVCLREGAAALRATSLSPELDARLLLCHVLGCSGTWLVTHPDASLEESQLRQFQELVARRARSEPVAYLVGRKEFFGRDFFVDSRVLVPRPETELIVEALLRWVQTQHRQEFRLLDLGSGSGCLGISLALELRVLGRSVKLTQVDASAAALEVSRINAEKLGCPSRLLFGNWFSELGSEQFELVVSNPPYVGTSESDLSPELRYEPAQALFAGPDGLDDLRRILHSLPQYLAVGGVFACEIGASQGGAALDLARTYCAGLHSAVLQDLSGRDRCLVLGGPIPAAK